ASTPLPIGRRTFETLPRRLRVPELARWPLGQCRRKYRTKKRGVLGGQNFWVAVSFTVGPCEVRHATHALPRAVGRIGFWRKKKSDGRQKSSPRTVIDAFKRSRRLGQSGGRAKRPQY